MRKLQLSMMLMLSFVLAKATTQLDESSCGATNVLLTTVLYADEVGGAVEYEFWVENSTLSYSKKIGTEDYFFTLAELNDTIKDSTTYTVKVRTSDGRDWTEYGEACEITTGNVSSKLIVADCGKTGVEYLDTLTVDTIGDSQSYTFWVHNSSGFSATYVTTNNYFTLYDLQDTLKDSTIYSVQVKYKIDGVWSAYGESCNITTGIVGTQLISADCGATNVAYTDTLTADTVSGAIAYEFWVYDASSYSQIHLSSDNEFSLHDLDTMPQPDTPYYVQVRAEVSEDIFTKYDSTCTIRTANSVSIQECGDTLIAFNQTLSTTNIPSATSYTFYLYNSSSVLIDSFVTTNFWFSLSDFTAVTITPATDYFISVNVVSTLDIAPGALCPIRTARTTANLTNDFCNTGNKGLSLFSIIEATTAFGSEIGYRFILYWNDPNNSNIYTKLDSFTAPLGTPPQRTFRMADFVNTNIILNQQYFVAVRVTFNGIDYGPEGSHCYMQINNVAQYYECAPIADAGCNMIMNHSFETYNPNWDLSTGSFTAANAFINNQVNCWFPARLTPDLYGNSATHGSTSARLVATTGEAVVQWLNHENEAKSSKHYVLTYDLRIQSNSGGKNFDFDVAFTDTSTGPPLQFPNTSATAPTNLQTIHQLTNVNHETWTTYQICDSAQDNYNEIYFHALGGVNDAAGFLDNIYLQPLADAGADIACGGLIGPECPITPAGSNTITYSWKNLTTGDGTGLSDSTASRPCATVTATTSFELTVTFNGATTCTAKDTVKVFNGSISFVNPTPAICSVGDSVTMEISNPVIGVLYEWYTDPFCPSGTAVHYGSSYIVSPTVSTTYYVKGLGNGAGYCGEITMAVLSNNPAIFGATAFCFAQPIELTMKDPAYPNGIVDTVFWTDLGGTAIDTGVTITVTDTGNFVACYTDSGCTYCDTVRIDTCCFDTTDVLNITAGTYSPLGTDISSDINSHNTIYVADDITFKDYTSFLVFLGKTVLVNGWTGGPDSIGGATINVQNTQFTVINSTFKGACDNMWYGINSISIKDSSYFNISGSSIKDAYRGVSLTTENQMQVSNSSFFNCYQGIYTFAHDLSTSLLFVTGTTFDADQTTMKAPFEGYISDAGIHAEHNFAYTPSNVVIENNRFSNALYGIHNVENSSGGAEFSLKTDTFNTYIGGVLLDASTAELDIENCIFNFPDTALVTPQLSSWTSNVGIKANGKLVVKGSEFNSNQTTVPNRTGIDVVIVDTFALNANDNVFKENTDAIAVTNNGGLKITSNNFVDNTNAIRFRDNTTAPDSNVLHCNEFIKTYTGADTMIAILVDNGTSMVNIGVCPTAGIPAGNEMQSPDTATFKSIVDSSTSAFQYNKYANENLDSFPYSGVTIFSCTGAGSNADGNTCPDTMGVKSRVANPNTGNGGTNNPNEPIGFIQGNYLGLARPNPARNVVYIPLVLDRTMRTAQVNIYNIVGHRVVLQQTLNNHEQKQVTFNTDGLSPGLYFYSLIVDNKLVNTKRLMITK